MEIFPYNIMINHAVETNQPCLSI